MATEYTPRSVTNGLVFYYDMGNTDKSWKGAPTTNLKPNPDFSDGLTSYGQYCSTTPTLTTVTDFPSAYGKSKTVIQCYSAASNCGGGNPGGMYFGNPVISAGSTYTISFWARCTSHTSIPTRYSNQNGSGDESTFSFSQTITNEWKKYSYTVNSLNLYKTTWYVWSTTFNAIWQYADFQIEQKSFATPFISGTRADTQVLADLTGVNTITATSLTYNSNNTFSFNGTGDYCVGSELGQLTTFTAETWFKPTSYPNNLSCTVTSVYPGTNSTVNFKIGYEGTSLMYGGFYDGGWRLTPGVSTTLNTWQQVVFTYNGSSLQIYSNGISGGSTSYVGTPNSGGSGIRIGRRWDTTDYFAGDIGIVKVYNRALSADEIYQNFRAVRNRFGI